MGRKKNKEAIVQVVILIAIASLLLVAMISKKINYYVHPRFYAGIWVSIIALFLFSISLISRIKKARHNVNVRHYMLFALPLVAALIFPAGGAKGKDMTIAKSEIVASSSEQKKTKRETDKSITDDTSLTEKEVVDFSEKYAKYVVDGVMVINDDIFADWYSDVYAKLNNFVGKKCTYLAQVYSMEDFKANQFLAGRYFMVCCAADMVGYGITCESNIRSELKEGEWITVTGTIAEYEYNGHMVPLLTDTKITKANAPEVEYIYYKNY